jgi:transcriptional regulator with XRE-family HTH domain
MSVKKKTSAEDHADSKTIGRRIRQIRGFDLTQEEFARKLGISQSQLSKYERGLALPAPEVLIQMKKSLNVSLDWLLTGVK